MCAVALFLGCFMPWPSWSCHLRISAKASLVLAHDPQVDASRAMATDVGLLQHQTVASKTIASLGLAMTPDEFLESMTVEPVSSELLSITMAAPTDAEAIRRLAALTSIYLDFRAEQLSTQSDVLVDGMQQRIQKLEGEVRIFRGALSSSRGRQVAQKPASSAIRLRSGRTSQGQIETLQQSVEDATLRNASVVASSRVIDPAAVEDGRREASDCIVLASGLIGGAALGCGMVLFFAITSDRLRRRSDVAAALEVPVPVSVGRIAPISKRLAAGFPTCAPWTAAVPGNASGWRMQSRWSFLLPRAKGSARSGLHRQRRRSPLRRCSRRDRSRGRRILRDGHRSHSSTAASM